MSAYDDEPRIDEPRPLSSIKFVRNAKGDTQVEVKVVEGADATEVARIRQVAFTNYKAAVEATGGLIPMYEDAA